MPLSHPGVVNKLTELYLSWVQVQIDYIGFH